MKTLAVYCIIVLFTLCLACSGGRRIKNHDLTTEGFITDACFQVIIKGAPDKNAVGLVDQRGNALHNAQIKVPAEVHAKLVNYYVDFYKEKNNIKDKSHQDIVRIRPIVVENAKKFLPYGYTAYTFYSEDKSAILIYRIYKNNLKQDILNMDLTDPSKKTKG